MRRLVPFCAALLLGGVANCSSPAPTQSLQQACANYVSAVRSAEYQCYGVAPESNKAVLWQRQAAACVLDGRAPGSTLGADFWQGVATIIGAATPQCSYYEYSDSPGTLGVGDPCFLGVQCSTLWCQGTTVSTSTGAVANDAAVCGTCAARLDFGASCDAATDVCVRGASCFGSHCRTLGQNGDPCTRTSDCSFPTVCTSQGTCGAAAWQGAPCTTAADCGTDQACDHGTSTCVPDTFNLPGQTCDGVVVYCERGACDTSTGLCPAVLPDGAACDPTDPSTQCDTYATCFEGTCQIVDPTLCR